MNNSYQYITNIYKQYHNIPNLCHRAGMGEGLPCVFLHHSGQFPILHPVSKTLLEQPVNTVFIYFLPFSQTSPINSQFSTTIPHKLSMSHLLWPILHLCLTLPPSVSPRWSSPWNPVCILWWDAEFFSLFTPLWLLCFSVLFCSIAYRWVIDYHFL